MLIESKNLIFRGAPGTGKSYLAKEIAADIISNGYYEKFTQLSEEDPATFYLCMNRRPAKSHPSFG